jgi:hypothetical protein
VIRSFYSYAGTDSTVQLFMILSSHMFGGAYLGDVDSHSATPFIGGRLRDKSCAGNGDEDLRRFFYQLSFKTTVLSPR